MLGEHALLATWATQAGVSGGKNFPALAKQLDRNSVEISKAIGSLYGAAAAKQFLNGKNLWRSHINNFVQYTVATAKGDKAGQKKAVTSLLAYVQTQAAFFAKATGLPKQAVVNDLTAHILQLKGALDSYHAKQYGKTFQLVHGSYGHMFMTGADLAGGIANRRGSASGRAALTHRFEEQHGGGGARVQRVRRRPAHRDLDLQIRELAPGVVEPDVLCADQEGGRSRQVDVGMTRACAEHRGDFLLRERCDVVVCRCDDRECEDGARRCANRVRVPRVDLAAGDEDAVGAGRVGAAGDRAEVAGLLQPDGDDEQRRAVRIVRAGVSNTARTPSGSSR